MDHFGGDVTFSGNMHIISTTVLIDNDIELLEIFERITINS